MATHEECTYDVLPYTKENLAIALSNDFIQDKEIERIKSSHFNYLLDYLGNTNDGLNAQTIVIEHKYLSKSYLNDYSSFYSTCFEDYKRFCKRIHFFKNKFDKSKFDSITLSPKKEYIKIWDSYLGYVVIRPLPQAIIGATLLKTYDCKENLRFYPGTRKYSINLFGKNLEIMSLAFQEQDSVVGACASSALWSTFHKVSTQEFFHTKLPSPSEITKSVKTFDENGGRRVPNKGLTIRQICETIDDLNLVPELITDIEDLEPDFTDISWIKTFVYAFNKIGIPVLLGIYLEDNGRHLVSITGYRFDSSAEQPKLKKNGEILLKSDEIIKFYAHDDQVGPFARFLINKKKNKNKYQLISPWKKNNEKHFHAKIECICVPLSDRIRLDFRSIYKKTLLLNHLLSFHLNKQKIIWDLYLDFSNHYKSELAENKNIVQRIKQKVLKEALPKYIWIAKARVNEILIAEFIFDATNIAQSNFCKLLNLYHDPLRSNFKFTINAESSGVKDFVLNYLSSKYLSLFLQEIE